MVFSFFFMITPGEAISREALKIGTAKAEYVLKERPLPDRHGQCKNCHRNKQRPTVTALKPLKREHTTVTTVHGSKKLNCTHCHDNSRHQSLRRVRGLDVSFRNTSGVCSECHSTVYKDWKVGVHGKLQGSWKGARVVNHCINCHNPHNVAFPKIQSDPPPPLPKFRIPKGSSHQ